MYSYRILYLASYIYETVIIYVRMSYLFNAVDSIDQVLISLKASISFSSSINGSRHHTISGKRSSGCSVLQEMCAHHHNVYQHIY